MLENGETRPIALTDRSEIERLYFRDGHGDSAHAFASLYIWQEEMGLRLWMGKDVYAVQSRWKGEGAWFFPVGGDAEKAGCIEALMRRGLKRLCYATEADAEFLERRFPGAFALRETPEDSEYLYDRQQMIDMPGKAYEKIRNRCRRLEKEHTLEALVLTPERLPEAAEVTRQWSRNTDTGEGILDTLAMEHIWSDWRELDMRGVMLRLDGVPWAVAAGYRLRDGEFDCCLLKARENLPGVTDHLRIALARSLSGQIDRLNLEEDLGVAGLRQMKERLRPCAMIRMYSGEIR